jgi:NAD-dependent dihydropyrimidine dehydrogenase PreA subunit
VIPVITQECRGCGACLLTCPEHAIRPGPRGSLVVLAAGPLVVLEDLCSECGECVEICPADAIEVIA